MRERGAKILYDMTFVLDSWMSVAALLPRGYTPCSCRLGQLSLRTFEHDDFRVLLQRDDPLDLLLFGIQLAHQCNMIGSPCSDLCLGICSIGVNLLVSHMAI